MEMKKVTPGLAYAFTYDGCGGIMYDHYEHKPAVVVNAIKRNSLPTFVDDYSSGVHPGFTLPEAKSKPVITEPKANECDITNGLTEVEIKELLADDFKVEPMEVDDVVDNDLSTLTKEEISLLFSL